VSEPIPPLLTQATLAAARRPFLRFVAQVGRGPTWEAARLEGDGVGTPRTEVTAGTIEGWVIEPAATQPTTAPGQPTVAVDPLLYVTGATLPGQGDVLTLAGAEPPVRYRVVGPTSNVLYPAFIMERL